MILIGIGAQPARTLLEALIRERRQTFEEFAEEIERLARDNGEHGTLSARHAQRLASGLRADGRPLGPVRPATRRLLEMSFGMPVDALLGPPLSVQLKDDAGELAARLAAARKVDSETVAVFRQQLELTRRLDRQLGGKHLAAELSAQVKQMQELLSYSTDQWTRQALAALIADACALLGWQRLDLQDQSRAWNSYAQGIAAANESGSAGLRSYVLASQSVVALDLDEPAIALDMACSAQESASGQIPRVLASWLSAAHGEALAANGEQKASLKRFDEAELLLGKEAGEDAPYLVFGLTHLNRWRGSALRRLRDRGASGALTRALDELPPGFIRAETGLRVDLAESFRGAGELDAAEVHAVRAEQLARQIGSARHLRRIQRLRGPLSPAPSGARAARR